MLTDYRHNAIPLPVELILIIFNYLECRDYKNFAAVCRQFRQISDSFASSNLTSRLLYRLQTHHKNRIEPRLRQACHENPRTVSELIWKVNKYLTNATRHLPQATDNNAIFTAALNLSHDHFDGIRSIPGLGYSDSAFNYTKTLLRILRHRDWAYRTDFNNRNTFGLVNHLLASLVINLNPSNQRAVDQAKPYLRRDIPVLLFRRSLYEAKLSGLNLSHLNLEWAIFMLAKLDKVNFENSNLSGAGFGEANLNYANFRGANLSEADMKHASIRGATFKGANLQKTDLCYSQRNYSRNDLPYASRRNRNIFCDKFLCDDLPHCKESETRDTVSFISKVILVFFAIMTWAYAADAADEAAAAAATAAKKAADAAAAAANKL